MENNVFYVHTPNKERNNVVFVTQKIKRDGKDVLFVVFLLDPPGSWDDEKWNLHIDGCDYLYDTMDDALKSGAEFYKNSIIGDDAYNYHFEYIDKPFDWSDENPSSYGISSKQKHAMTKKEIRELHNQARDLFESAFDNDTIILCIDGNETDNTYPVYLWKEPDCKKPKDWVNSIIHFCGNKGKLSFIKKNNEL